MKDTFKSVYIYVSKYTTDICVYVYIYMCVYVYLYMSVQNSPEFLELYGRQ